MKEQTEKYLSLILREPEAWDKKSGELKEGFVYSCLSNLYERDYYDDYYWPKVQRFCHLLKLLCDLPDDWEILTMGYNKDIEVWWLYSFDIPERFEYIFYDTVHAAWGEYMNFPEADEILALDIHPPLVANKVLKDGTIQGSMFDER